METNTLQNRPATRSRAVDWMGLAVALVVTFGVATFAAQFQPGDWYRELAKPSWTPPGWIFPPVWTYLYATMAVAAWLVWRSGRWIETRVALLLYAIQLAFNGLWSWLFFGRQMVDAALVDIFVLLAAIIAVALTFRKRSRLAGWLFVPYTLWVAFASSLNLAISLLN